jgi:hypothetical protein
MAMKAMLVAGVTVMLGALYRHRQDAEHAGAASIRSRRVKGNGAGFSFYFPPKEQYQGRFFQPTDQLQTSENAPPGSISFAVF